MHFYSHLFNPTNYKPDERKINKQITHRLVIISLQRKKQNKSTTVTVLEETPDSEGLE